MNNLNKYLVARVDGGVQEQPYYTYHNFQVIFGRSREEAKFIYNERYEYTYFKGTVFAEVINGKVKIVDRAVTYDQVDYLVNYVEVVPDEVLPDEVVPQYRRFWKIKP